MPLLSLIIDVREAAPIVALCGMVINIYLIYQLRAHIKFFELRTLVIAAIIGVPTGVYLLSHASSDLLKVILGIIILAFVILSFYKVFKPRNLNPKWGYFYGFMSGLMGGAFNTSGPPVIIYFYLNGKEKVDMKAALTGYFTLNTIMIIISHAVGGLTTMNTVKTALYCLPGVLAGIYFGHKLFNKIPQKIYNKVILIFLGILSILLITGY